VYGITNGLNDLWLGSNTNVVLSPGSESSAFVGDTSNPDNQIATLGDLENIGSSDTPITSVVYVDYLRQDSYTEAGSQLYPYKTLANALDKAETLSPSLTNPIRIAIVSGNTSVTAETIELNTGNIFITGVQSSGTHAPINWHGKISFNGSSTSVSDNQFSITGISIKALSGENAIVFSGANPQSLYMKDVSLTGNGAADAMIINNSGGGSVQGKNLKIGHNGSGNYYAINSIAGSLTLDSIESVGGNTGVISVGDSVKISNSEINSFGANAIKIKAYGSLLMTNCKIISPAEDSIGIDMSNSPSSVTLNNVYFDVQVYGDNAKAISGVTGTTLRYAALTFSPFGGNDKISSAITSIAMDTAPSFVS
jgi:hypothetical protein